MEFLSKARRSLAKVLQDRLCRRGSVGLVLFCMGGGVLVSGSPAGAAQIDITSCQPKQVRICSLDKIQIGYEVTGDHVFSQGETKHFTCDANCKFWITEHCPNGHCDACLDGSAYLDHSWGKGAYQLIALEKNSDGQYKSSDLQKSEPGMSCP